MKIFKIIGSVFAIYVLLVVAFESMIGYAQPQGENTIVLTTNDGTGGTRDRVVSALEVDGKLYVAANHWPRAWFNELLVDPHLQVTLGATKSGYVAHEANEEEFERVNAKYPLGPIIRVLTGFPPRRLMRLDPEVPTTVL